MSDTYRYIDNSGMRSTEICITPDGWTDGRACISLDGDDIAFLPADERQAAAQALAGDEWRVVPAKAATVDPDSLDLMHEDLARILDALGLGDHARPYSPHECVTRDVLPAIERLKTTANMPEWERTLLAGQAAQEEIDQLKRNHDDLEKRLYEAEVQAAQPDRPEPVDPASVKVGQVVEIEADDGSWMVRGQVDDVDDTIGNEYLPVCIQHPNGENIWIDARESDATVRVLHAAEPEPDEAAVEALAKKLYAVKATRIGLERDWSEIGNADQLRHRTEALTLIRDHRVRQEVPDA